MSSKYVVVGAGLAGSAAAWQLARSGREVTLLERTQPATHDGSSHGSARIFRYAYPDPLYVELVVRARAGYADLEAASGRELISQTGALDFGLVRDPSLLAGVLDAVGVEHELLSAAAAQSRFPQIKIDTEALWHPGAGVIDAENTVNSMVAAAAAAGAAVLTDWPVDRVTKHGAGYRISSGDGRTLDAERVVVTAGAWLPWLLDRLPLAAGFRSALPKLEVSQESVYHFPYRDGPESARPGLNGTWSWPTVIHQAENILTYSLPGGRDAGFRGQKIAEFNNGRKLPTAPDRKGEVDLVNQKRVTGYVRRQLPGLIPEPYATTTCLFTNTPTEDFVIDSVDGITIVSACSGHGAKFAPLLGELAAAAATGELSAVPSRFRPATADSPR